jgi:hypothetical protein
MATRLPAAKITQIKEFTPAAFRVNTCLLEGQFNPIIPFLKRPPQWWDMVNDPGASGDARA